MDSPLRPSSTPGLLVGRETLPTLPVVDAAPVPQAVPPPLPEPPPPPPRPSSGRARRSSARQAHVPPPLEAAQIQAGWVTFGVLATLSAGALILALARILTPAPAPLRGSAPPVTRHLAAPAAPPSLELDPTVFHHDVEPVLKAECWSCHGEAGAGELRLRTGADGVSPAAVLAFVVPGRPEASPLLVRPLGPAWGGPPHPDLGWSPDSPQVQLLERWIAGSAVPSRVTPLDPEDP
ncbi:MAG: hypothetical protein R3F62_21830 [Planctomycetota bacterium]